MRERLIALVGCALAAWTLAAAPAQATASAPCVELADLGDEGLGGTGLGGDDGVGGTGLGDEDGIGGTGIYGTITARGSICVNGLRVHFDDDVEVSRDGEPDGVVSLEVGRVVWLTARERDGLLYADAIEVWSALRGPLEISANGQLRVAGVEVDLAESLEGSGLRVGEAVEVSGLWEGDARVRATRIDRLERPTPPRIMPRIDLAARAPRVRTLAVEGWVRSAAMPSLHGLAIDARPRELPPVGERVWVRGRVTPDGRLRAERIDARPDLRPPPRPTRPDAKPDTPQRPRKPRVDPPQKHTPPERPLRPDPALRPQRPERFERPTSGDRIERVEPQSTDLR